MRFMDVKDAIRARRSVRSYKNKEVSRDKIEEIINLVRLAPSASNRQEWKFIVVDDEKKKEELRECASYKFIGDAPIIIAGVCTNPNHVMSCRINAGIVDLSIAMDHLTLKAAEEGLGTCWIGGFDQGRAKEVLEIPAEYEIVTLMPLGYPERPLKEKSKDRKDLEEVICYNTFSSKSPRY